MRRNSKLLSEKSKRIIKKFCGAIGPDVLAAAGKPAGTLRHTFRAVRYVARGGIATVF